MKYPRLRDLREDCDLSQLEVASKINTSQSYYAQYENGNRPIPFERIIELAKYYKVSIDYIAGLTNDKKGLNKSDLQESEEQLLKKFRSLSSERKGKILERMDMLTEEQEEENQKIKGAI